MLVLIFLTLSVCSGILLFFTAAGTSIVLNVVFLTTTAMFLFFLVRLVALSATASITGHQTTREGSATIDGSPSNELHGSHAEQSRADSGRDHDD